MEHSSIPAMFFHSTRQYAERVLFSSKVNGTYQDVTYGEAEALVRKLALALATRFAVKKGDRVSIVSFNRMEWALADLAILSLGAYSVPVYPNLPANLAVKVLIDAQSKAVFVEDRQQAEKILSIRQEVPGLETIIQMDREKPAANDVHSLYDLIRSVEEELKQQPEFPDPLWQNITREEMCTLIYTSGTTGDQKGVMLSHENILSNLEDIRKIISISAEDVFLSFLPLSHSYERTAGYYLPIHSGSNIAYAVNMETVGENMGEVRPTLMVAVPRFFEKMQTLVLDSIKEGSGLKQKIFHWALKVGSQRFQEEQNGHISGWTNFRFGIASKLVFEKIRMRLGGRLRFFVSGAAPLEQSLGEFFYSAGVLILEGYGITETSPVLTVNRPESFRFGTVGNALDRVEIKIADDGEILAKGPNIMMGYFNRPDATEEALKDGWYHTGDIGFMDDGGFLKITDRKKNLIVTSGGKNVAPQPIELMLQTSPLISQVLLLGDKRNFISALIVPDFDKLSKICQMENLQCRNTDELIRLPRIYEAVQTEVDRLTADLARYERPRKIMLLGREFSIEEGEMTPSLKIKRGFVMKKYDEVIESIYAE